MKKTFLALLLSGVMVLSFGCKKDDPQTTPPPTPTGFSVSLAVSSITDSEATVTATASDETTVYVIRVISDALYQRYGSKPEGIADYLKVLWTDSTSSNPGKTLEEVVTLFSSTGKGTFHATELLADTKYWAFAVAVDAQGVPTQTAVVKDFTTSKVAEITMTIDVTDIKATSATITTTPGDDKATYYCDYLSDEEYQQYGGKPEGIAEHLKDIWAELSGNSPDERIEDLVAQVTSIGSDYYDVTNLKSETKYWAFAVFVDAKGVPTQTAVVKDFTTQKAILKLTVSDLEAGDDEGDNLDTAIHALIKSEAAVSLQGSLVDNDTLLPLLLTSTYEEINTEIGEDFPTQYVDACNSEDGFLFWFAHLMADKEYCLIITVTDADGNTLTVHKEGRTSAAVETNNIKGRTAPVSGRRAISLRPTKLSDLPASPMQVNKLR